MPYQTNGRLGSLINTVLQDQEIKLVKSDIGMTDEDIRQIVIAHEKQIWSFAISAIEGFDHLERQYETMQTSIESSKPVSPSSLPVKKLPIVPLIIITLLSASGFALNYFRGKTILQFYYTDLKSIWLKIACIGLAIIFTVFVILAMYRTIVWELYLLRKRRVNRIYETWEEETLAVRQTYTSLKQELESREDQINKMLIEGAIKEVVRQELNKLLNESYSTKMEPIKTYGLAEVIDMARTIDTSAKNSLNFLLNSMPGGSIGIAGPRGAGKSTLIKSFCGKERTIKTIKGREIIPVFTTAPVQYDARDFILHLFSTTCQNILQQEKVTESNEFDKRKSQSTDDRINSPLASLLSIVLPLCRLFGPILLSIGVFFAVILARLEPEPATKQQEQQSSNNSQSPKDDTADKKLPSGTFTYRLIKSLNVTPGSFLLWGIILTIIGLYTNRFMRTRRGMVFSMFQYKVRVKEIKEPISPIVKNAQDWLHKIKYQQTFTSGWSGGLKLPVGIETSLNNVLTLAEKQMSNPDIVYAFAQFIQSIPQKYQVIIGIDELDKLESDETAQLFLNEIKSIFGLPGCFYLISVSENAMNQFERRGLPFRDAFDSSFDNIIYVDYLNLENTKSLLMRRVIGKPIPYFDLAYVLSGGLPRDVIRTFRQIIELQDTNNPTMSRLCDSIVRIEVKGKIRAVSHAVKKITAVPLSEVLFDELFTLIEDINLRSIKTHLKKIKDLNEKIAEHLKVPDESRAQIQSLSALTEEFFAYLYLMLTVLELFTDSLQENDLKACEKSGELDRLGRARQTLSIDPGISKNMIDTFRLKHKLASVFSDSWNESLINS